MNEEAGVARVEKDFARDGATSLAGEHPIAAFQWSVDILRRDECHVVADTQSSPLVPEADRLASASLDIISCMGAPIIKGGTLVGALCVTGARPREWSDAEVDLLREVSDRLWSTIERAKVERALRESEAKYRRLFDNMDEGYLLAEVIRDDTNGSFDIRYLEANPAAVRMVNADFTGRRLSEVEDGFDERWWTVPEQVLRTGEPQRMELWAEPIGQWFDIGVTKIDDSHVVILFREVTERKRHERERELLVRELNHRVKNMLAVVSSIANQTMRTSPDMTSFVDAFGGRIRSLSRAHQILTQSNWEGADLRDLVEQMVDHFVAGDKARVELTGECVILDPNAALSLSLALHELATNALKHGAWSGSEGKVSIGWRDSEDGRLVLDWQETGGPEVTAPKRSGFGSKLLERGVARELGGHVSVKFHKQGVHCRIELERERNGDTEESGDIDH